MIRSSNPSSAGTVKVRKLMSVAEVCQIVGVSERTVRRWLAERRLGFYKVGGVVRVSLQSVNDFLGEHYHGPDD